jgi:hypothetical protein
VVEGKKSEYIAFYLREILGSKVQLPPFVANGLQDFFASYLSIAELEKEVIPAVEKALLRSPEIVLNDLISPLILALPTDIDLSGILATNLLKPLLSNTKSTNASTREGALRTFKVLAARSSDETLIEKSADEIIGPLKGNKITAADQRLQQAEMLAAFKPSASLTAKVLQGLHALCLKETNEPAAFALTSTLGMYLQHALKNDLKIDNAAIDAFAKGVAEKRAPLRRIWAQQVAECLWNLNEKELNHDSTLQLIDACIGKLLDIFNEVIANPIPALQAGQVSVACATSALHFKTELDRKPEEFSLGQESRSTREVIDSRAQALIHAQPKNIHQIDLCGRSDLVAACSDQHILRTAWSTRDSSIYCMGSSDHISARIKHSTSACEARSLSGSELSLPFRSETVVQCGYCWLMAMVRRRGIGS